MTPVGSVLALALSLVPMAAAAQGTPPPPGQGPMTVERVTSSFLVAPQVKVTRFDRKTTELVGGYAGRLTDRTFFIGGGGYWMAERSRDRQLAYGGVVVGLQSGANGRVGFAVKGLVGGGRATIVRSELRFDDDHDVRILTPAIVPKVVLPPTPVFTDVRVREEFFIFEPDASLVFKLTRRVRLTAGAGYRWVGRARGGRDGLGGPSGSVGLQIG